MTSSIGGAVEPDREAVPLMIAKGTHTLTLTLRSDAGKALFARVQDPDRKLSYPESK